MRKSILLIGKCRSHSVRDKITEIFENMFAKRTKVAKERRNIWFVGKVEVWRKSLISQKRS
jgi:hypothetical protein